MIKGNYGQSYQQSLNEIFATKLHEQQGFSQYTPYSLARVQVDGNNCRRLKQSRMSLITIL